MKVQVVKKRNERLFTCTVVAPIIPVVLNIVRKAMPSLVRRRKAEVSRCSLQLDLIEIQVTGKSREIY
jgi:hypothetical protein